MLEGFHLDPYVVLGIARDASPEEIREAFHEKSKKHHPDQGGDEWAFRIVVRAYEILGPSRSRTAGIEAGSPDRSAAAAPTFRAPIFPVGAADVGQIRPGLHDRGVPPDRIVSVEIVWMRYQVEDVTELLMLSQAERNLSGSIHILWPDPESSVSPPPTGADAAAIRQDLLAIYDNLKTKTKADATLLDDRDDRFEAWLSYPSGSVAWEAFKVLHVSLKLRGLGVRQWTRDLTIPRAAG